MSTPLFRPEVIQARQVQWLGEIRIARPISFTLVTGTSLMCAVALVAFAIWGEYTRKVSVPGVLLPEAGVMDVSSPQAGTVAEVFVREGETVTAGQPLMRIRAERYIAGGDLGQLQATAVRQRRQGLETELRLLDLQAQQRSSQLSDRLQSLQSDEFNLQAELDAMRKRVALANETVKNFDDLAGRGFVPALLAQQKQEELLELGQRERIAQRNLEAARRERATLIAELALSRTQFDAGRAQLHRQLVSLAQEGSELDARSAWMLTAPRAGKVAVLSAVPGQAVQPGLNLAALLPSRLSSDEALVAHLYAPSRAAGFVEPGQEVYLRYAAYPYQKFGMHRGWVLTVSNTPVSPQDLPIGRAQALMQATQTAEPLYRIQVRLAQQDLRAFGETYPLRVGMALDAQIRQDGRRIWEWVFEPLLSL
jgi:membrane fusion protein